MKRGTVKQGWDLVQEQNPYLLGVDPGFTAFLVRLRQQAG